MTRKYTLIVVEGPHDQAFVGRVLSLLGMNSFRHKPQSGKEELLDPVWEAWKPKIKSPRRLYDPIFMPAIYDDERRSVAVLVAGGSEIFGPFAKRLANQLAWLTDLARQGGTLAIVADADQKPVDVTFADLATALVPVIGGFGEQPGVVVDVQIPTTDAILRTGAFILPNNDEVGTVESVLLPLGLLELEPLLLRAHSFVDECDESLKAHFAPFDHLKAVVATAASILQPGSTNTVTIEKDAWITADGLAHPALAPFVDFLRLVLDIPQPTTPTPPTAATVGDDLIQDLL